VSRNPITVIAFKEMLDSIRDRRTLIAMIVLPLLLIPIFVIGMPIAIQTLMAGEVVSASPIAIVGAEDAPVLVGLLGSNEMFEIVETQNATQSLRDGEVSVVLRIPENFEDDLAAEVNTNLTIEYLSSDTSSQIAEGKLRYVIDGYRDSIVAGRLDLLGIDVGVLTPFVTSLEDASTPQEQSGYWLGMIVPLFLGMWAAMGGMYTAIDVTAGEKERGSLEALLSTPPTKTQIVMGKFVAVVAMAMLSVVTALIVLIVSLYFAGGAAVFGPGTGDAGDVGVHISVEAYLLILLICFLLASMIGAIEIAICTFAKSFKEAQNYVTPITFIVVFPAVFTQFISIYDLTAEVFAIPIINAIFVFKEILFGIVDFAHIGITMGTTLLYALICIFIAVKVFRREDVLFR